MFDTTFVGNEKNCQNINFIFSFPIRTFFKWIINQCSKGIREHFPSTYTHLISVSNEEQKVIPTSLSLSLHIQAFPHIVPFSNALILVLVF